MPKCSNAIIDSSIDIGGGSSPSPFLGGVLNFWELGDILTGLNGVLLVVPDVLAEVLMLFGLATPKPLMVGGGVANFAADSVIFSSTSAKNCSSFSSDVISMVDTRLLDQGEDATESNPGEFCTEDKGETDPGTRYKEDEEIGVLEGLLVGRILLPPLEFNLSALIRDDRLEPVIG